MNIVKTTLLVLTLGLGLAAGQVKGDVCDCSCIREELGGVVMNVLGNVDCIDKCKSTCDKIAYGSGRYLTEAAMVKNMSYGQLVHKYIMDHMVQGCGGYAGCELLIRGSQAVAKATLAFVKNHPCAAVTAGVGGAILLAAKVRNMILKKEALKRQLAEQRRQQREEKEKQAVADEREAVIV